HIGVFLMTFAGYNPDEAVRLWQRMEQLGAGQSNVPEILSDHPSNAERLRNIAGWAPRAKAAKQAYDEGKVEPAARAAHARRRVAREVLWAKAERYHPVRVETNSSGFEFDTSIAAFL